MNIDLKHAAGSDAPCTAHPPEPTLANGNGRDAHPTSNHVLVDDVLDVDGVMRLLRIGRNTVYELVGRNEIPHRRLGKQIRFSRTAIMRWLDSWSSQGAKERQ
jgi:excisionase family DNA binding protein